MDRRLFHSDIADNPNALSIWLWLLACANVQDSIARIDGRQIKIPRGSILTSNKEIARKACCSTSTVHNHLTYLENRGSIERKSYKTGTVIRVVNWDSYQLLEEDVRTQTEREPNVPRSRPERDPNHIEQEYKNTKRDSLPRARAREEALGLVQSWNLAFAQELIIPQVRVDSLTPTSARLRTITAALKRHPELGFWTTEVFPRILASDFLTGKIAGKSGEPFKCSFDWVLKEANLTKILEGNYANKRAAIVQSEPPPPPDSVEAKIQAAYVFAKKRIAELEAQEAAEGRTA